MAFAGLSHAQAQPAARGQGGAALQKLEQQLDQQQQALKAQEAALEQTRRQLEQLQIKMQVPPGQASTATTPQPGSRQNSQKVAKQQSSPQQQVGKAPPNPQKQQAEQVAPVLEQPGVLTPKGHFVLEPSLQYSYSTNSRVALVGYTIIPAITIGLIDVRETNSTTAVAAFTGRYGLTNRLEAELKVPYVYRHDEAITRPLAGSGHDEVFNASGHDIGDIEVALRYQFNQGGPSFPYFIGSLRGIFPTGKGPFDVPYSPAVEATNHQVLQEKLPTGTGSYGIEPGLLMLYPSDPVVFFAGVDYLWRFKHNVDKDIAGGAIHIGNVDPGNALDFHLGMGLALNDRSSLSIGYQHTYIEKTKIDGSTPPAATNTQLSQLQFGFSYALTPKTNLNLTINAGLTRDTPDVGLTLRVPLSF